MRMKSWLLQSPLLIIILVTLISNCSEDSNKTNNQKTISEEKPVSSKQAVQLPKMIDLGSKNCIPCKKMAPIIDSLKIAYQGKAEIIFIDIKEDKKAARDYGITLIPTQVFIDTLGNEIYRHIGFFPADSITAHIKTMGSQI